MCVDRVCCCTWPPMGGALTFRDISAKDDTALEERGEVVGSGEGVLIG